jgi:hypothetical protein
MSAFVLAGIDPAPFAALFDLGANALAERNVVRRIADAPAGFPCRVSLEDAAVGEELLLLPFEHHAADSPYRASGPIYVRRGVARAQLPPGVVPGYVTRRLISLRAYDRAQMMVGAEVVEGVGVAARLEALFAETSVEYVQLHNARPGCFSCEARRVEATTVA